MLLLLDAKTKAEQVAQVKIKATALTHKFHFLQGEHNEFISVIFFVFFDLSFISNAGKSF